jgi:hypothetical protein
MSSGRTKEAGLCVREDVAICESPHAANLAAIIRHSVVAMHRTDAITQDAPEKARSVYDYLASEEFRGDFKEITACSQALDDQIAAKRSHHDRIWASRDRLQEGCGPPHS